MLPYPLKYPLREGVFWPNPAYPALAQLCDIGPHLAYGFFTILRQSNGMSLCLQFF
jgi:hypothetical protein